MRFFESNYRYNMHSLGFHYIVEFNTRTRKDRDMYFELVKAFINLYGEEKESLPPEPGAMFSKWKINENWRTEYRASLKRRRIYLKEASAYTMAMLRLS